MRRRNREGCSLLLGALERSSILVNDRSVEGLLSMHMHACLLPGERGSPHGAFILFVSYIPVSVVLAGALLTMFKGWVAVIGKERGGEGIIESDKGRSCPSYY